MIQNKGSIQNSNIKLSNKARIFRPFYSPRVELPKSQRRGCKLTDQNSRRENKKTTLYIEEIRQPYALKTINEIPPNFLSFADQKHHLDESVEDRNSNMMYENRNHISQEHDQKQMKPQRSNREINKR